MLVVLDPELLDEHRSTLKKTTIIFICKPKEP